MLASLQVLLVVGVAGAFRTKLAAHHRKASHLKDVSRHDLGADNDLAATAWSPNSTLTGAAGEYSLSKQIGKGGFGAVHLATTQTGEEVIVKLALDRDQEKAKPMFQQEASMMKLVSDCPNVVQLIDQGFEADKAFLVMSPYASNGNLSKAKSATGTSDYARFVARASDDVGGMGPLVRLGKQILEALACFAKKAIIYSDLKAENILLVAGPESADASKEWFQQLAADRQIKLTDFGLTSQLSPEEQELAAKGELHQARMWSDSTVTIAAPELLLPGGHYEGFSWSFDMFSFGALMLKMGSNIDAPKNPTPSKMFTEWCETLADSDRLYNHMGENAEMMPGFFTRVAITDRCMKETILRSLALDPSQRISPQNALKLFEAVGDDSACEEALEALGPRPADVPADICAKAGTIYEAEDGWKAALEAALKPQDTSSKKPRLSRKKANGAQSEATGDNDKGSKYANQIAGCLKQKKKLRPYCCNVACGDDATCREECMTPE